MRKYYFINTKIPLNFLQTVSEMKRKKKIKNKAVRRDFVQFRRKTTFKRENRHHEDYTILYSGSHRKRTRCGISCRRANKLKTILHQGHED